MTDPLSRWLLLVEFAATAYMTGLIWFVQIVHYPLFGSVGRDEFPRYETRHASLTTWVVAPPMLVELATAILLVWLRPAEINFASQVVGGALLAVIWLSTFLVQVPCHDRLAASFDAAIHRRLVVSNWLRTIAWTLRSVLLLGVLDRLIR